MRKHPTSAVALDPTTCNCLAVRQAARQITQVYDRHLAAVGLRTTQYSILAKLCRLGPLSVNALAAAMVMDRTTMGRAIRPLERDRLVATAADRDDGRARIVRLTAAGETRFKAAVSQWKLAQREFENAYGPADAAKLRSALAQIVTAV